MNFNILRFIVVSLLILQPVFLQCLEEAIDQELVNSYKNSENASLREHHASFLKHIVGKIFNKNTGIGDRWRQYKAANEVQKQLDDQRVNEFKNNEIIRNNLLSQEEGWFSKSRDKKLAERAQKEIDLVNKKKVQDITKDEFRYISDTRLSQYNTQELVTLAHLFTPEKLPENLSNAINQKFTNESTNFPDAGIKYLRLTYQVVSSLKRNQASFIAPEQINEILNNSGPLSHRINILNILLKMSVSDDVRNQIDKIKAQVEKEIAAQKSSKEKLQQIEKEKNEVQKLILTSDVIDELVQSKKIQLVTKYQVVSFLKNNKDLNNPQLLLTLRKVFDHQSVPEELQKALDASYVIDQEPFKDYIQYISKDAQAEVKRREEKASFEAKRAARSKNKPDQQAKQQEAKQSKSTFKNQSENFQAEDQARQVREEQERIKKEQEARRRAQAEAEAKEKMEQERRAGEEKSFGITSDFKYFLENRQQYTKFLKDLKELGFTGNVLDKDLWKKFYRQNALILHPDKTSSLPDAQRSVAEEKFKQLGFVNDELNAY